MPGVFDSLARGVESGFGMGMRFDAAQEEKRARAFQEGRQKTADARADQAFAETQRQQADNDFARTSGAVTGLLEKRKGELEGLSVAARTANQPIDPAVASEYGDVSQKLSVARQQAMDYWSRAQGGRVDPLQTPDADLYRNTALAIGRRPEELPEVARSIKDMQDAIQTGNTGLAVQSANVLMAPQLRRGVGSPSPYGGKIIRKEIIGLDPARGGDGRDHPNMVIPRLRVYVQPDDSEGTQVYYDAPMSKDGGTDDAPVAIDMAHAMDWMGNLGVLANAMQRPEFAAKLDAGSKQAGADVDKYLQQLTQIGDAKRAPKTGADQARLDTITRYMRENGLDPRNADDVKTATDRLHQMGVMLRPGVGAATFEAKSADIDRRVASGEITAEEAAEERRILTTGVKPQTALQQVQTKIGEARLAGTLPVPKKAVGATGAASSGVPAADAGLTGDEFLATVPADKRDNVKALATGKMKPTDIPIKERQGMIAMALRYKPDAEFGKNAEIGSRESVFIQRVILAGNQAAHDLENVVALPMTASSGLFGGRTQGAGLFDATKEVLANKLTTQEVQSYNVMSTGFQRALASIEAAGLMPTGSLTHQMDAVIFKEGDTNFTKLQKLAQTRQIVEAGLETTVSNPRIPKETRDHAEGIIKAIQKSVPFTQQDLLRLDSLQQTNPNVTLKDVQALKRAPAAAAPAAPKYQTATNPKTGEKLMFKDGAWVPLQ